VVATPFEGATKDPVPQADPRPFPGVLAFAVFAAGYAAAYLYAYSVTLQGRTAAPVWAPDAVLFCALFLFARRSWWIFLLLAVPIRLALTTPSVVPAPVQLFDLANHALKAVVAVSVLQRWKPGGSFLSSSRDFARFGAVAVVAVPALSAFVGVGIRQSGGSEYWRLWMQWFLGDALANLVLTPLILSFDSSMPSRAAALSSWRRRAEGGLLLAGLLVSGALAFRGRGMSLPTEALLLCIPFPFLLWSALRFGVRGTSAALSLLALSGTWAVSRSPGPSLPGQLQASVFSLQLFLLVTGSSLLFLAVVLEERRAMEENLGRTKARLARAEAASMVMAIHVAIDGRFLRVPRKLAALLGASRKELLQRTVLELTHPEDRAAELAENRRLLSGEIASFQLEKRKIRSDGTPVWVYLSRSVVRDSEGKPIHFLDYLTDIGDLKRAEQAVRQSENDLRLFAEHSPAAVAVLDHELRFVMASRRFREDFQRDDRPIVGRRFDEALVGFPSRWPDALRRSLQGDSESSEEDTFTKPDGATETLRWEIVPGPRVEGKPAAAFLFAELTTERKRGERALEEVRRELAHLMRVSILGELSGALAHELAQPLAAILANAQAAQSYLTRGPAGIAEVASILEDIVSDDLRAGEVIRSLRKLLRKGEPEFREIDINDLVREALDLAESDLITKRVTVGLQLASNLPAIRGDRVQLQQVMLNLIVNACEAMSAVESGERRLRIATSEDGDESVHVSVQDTGPGVAPEIRERLFEPFLSTKSVGLGLGLTISRSLVTAHGGTLWQTNVESGGATFHITLPRWKGTE